MEEEKKLIEVIAKYESIEKETPVFHFFQEVKCTNGFYKGYTGKIFKELDYVPHPDPEKKEQGIVISYEVIIYKNMNEENEEIIDRRMIEAKNLEPME